MTLSLPTAPAAPARWGFCPHCERWRLSDAWGEPGDQPRCPVCGTPPDSLETFHGATGSLVLHLVHTAAPADGAGPGGGSADPGPVAPNGDRP